MIRAKYFHIAISSSFRLVFPYPPRLFGYRQKNHEKINSSRKNRLKKSMTRRRRYPKTRGDVALGATRIQKHGGGIKILVIGFYRSGSGRSNSTMSRNYCQLLPIITGEK